MNEPWRPSSTPPDSPSGGATTASATTSITGSTTTRSRKNSSDSSWTDDEPADHDPCSPRRGGSRTQTAVPTNSTTTTTMLSSSSSYSQRRKRWYLNVSVLAAAGVSLYQLNIALNVASRHHQHHDHHHHRGGGGSHNEYDPSSLTPRTSKREKKNVLAEPPFLSAANRTKASTRDAHPVVVEEARTASLGLPEASGGQGAAEPKPSITARSDANMWKASSRLVRLDDAAPPARYAVTHYLQSSIPAEMRLPPHRAVNETLLYSDPLLQKRKYVFEFNPSLVVLPNSQRAVAPNAAYVACYRVSTQHACYHQERNDNIKHRNYVGFAILDANLNILLETTVNPSNAMRRFEDFRLFVLNDELYVGSFQSLHRFWVHDPPTEGRRRRENGPAILPSLTPDQPNNLTIAVERFKRCSRDPEILRTAKSLTYFAMPNGSIVMEPFPMAEKEIILDVSCDDRNESIPKVSIPLSSTHLPHPSFRTTDEEYLTKTPGMRLPALTSDRGSYCCATIEHGGDQYLLGVSHLKTRYFNAPTPRNPTSNQYFTRFYALQTEPPYDVVARTGKFCFGAHWAHMSTTHSALDNDNHQHRSYVPDPYLNLTSSRRLVLGNESYRCPGIHFVSGMSDDATDPKNRLVIGYGVNDCFAQFVVVDKSDVARMLFG